MKVYIMTTNDEYEFPIAMADTMVELGRITNVNVKTIRSAIYHVKSGRLKNSIYKEVEIGDLEDE